MAIVVKDRVRQSASAPGTGTITLGATTSGFQAFSAIGNGNVTYFAIVDAVSGAWEVNYGTYTSSGTTLSRNATPLSSSNAGALVNFTGAVDVFCTYPSSKSVYLDTANVVEQLSFGAITATSVAMTTGTITTTPVNNTDIVNKQYADAIASGIHFHEAVDLATTAALPANTYNNGTSGVGATLTANANGALSVDSTLTVVANRILVKNEATQANNGVYVVTQVGSAGTPYILTRATDFDSVGTGVDQIDEGDFFLVTSGTANVNTAWVQQTPPPITIGSTALVFQQFSAPITYTAGTGLSESPTYTFNIANTGTAGTYGSASQVPVFVTNAQGQVTSVANTSIAINGTAVTGNITGSAGSVANALTLGTYLTGTSYNGSAAVTATVDATSANTASKVVARDASGDFSAGTITAALSGNATTATTATNVAGGTANQIVYNTSAGTTSFAAAPSASNQLLSWNGSAYAWTLTPTVTSLTVSGGTANGVTYLNGSQVLTSGSTLTFDGTKLGIGTASPAAKLEVSSATGSATPTPTEIRISTTTSAADFSTSLPWGRLSFYSADVTEGGAKIQGAVDLVSATTGGGRGTMVFKLSAAGSGTLTERMRITSTGQVGIASSSTTYQLQIGGTGQETANLSDAGPYGASLYLQAANSAAGAGGAVLFGTNFGNSTPFAAIKGLIFSGDTNTTGDLAFSTRVLDADTALTEQMRLTIAGNVGLGTTTPIATVGYRGFSISGSTGGIVEILAGATSVGKIEASATGVQVNSVTAQPLTLKTNNADRVTVDSVGSTYIETGNLWQYAPAPATRASAGTLTAAQLFTGILNTTGTTYTVTVPTGTNIDAFYPQVPAVDIGFDFFVINTASGTITMAVNTGVTSLGALTIATATSAMFRFRRTAANTYVMYRLR